MNRESFMVRFSTVTALLLPSTLMHVLHCRCVTGMVSIVTTAISRTRMHYEYDYVAVQHTALKAKWYVPPTPTQASAARRRAQRGEASAAQRGGGFSDSHRIAIAIGFL